MVDFAGSVQSSTISYYDGDDNGSPKAYERGTATLKADTYVADLNQEMFNLVAGPGKTDFVVGNSFVSLFQDLVAPDWFENYHVIPRSFDFGNILSTQTSPLDVFSGFRKLFGVWSSFVNNAGAGTTIIGQPSLPTAMNPLAGHALTLEVSTSGNPSVDDTLDFVFDGGAVTISVPIVLNRIVLFPVRPELPYSEQLQFMTDILPKESGKEQRLALRKNPRQLFSWRVRLDDGTFEMGRIDSLLFDWQSRTWGVPMWHEATSLTVAATAGDLTLNVGSSANADYRVGGLVLIYSDSQTFDVQTVASTTATTITIQNAILNSYSVGAEVAPLRAGNMRNSVSASRTYTADQELSFSFRLLNNDANLADITGWSSYNGKVLLDTCNVMRSSRIEEQFLRDIIVIDNSTGITSQDSPWDNGRRSTTLTLRSNSRAETWDLRQLLHHLRGKQISFYVPTFGQDMITDVDLLTASQDLVITNIGYAQFVRQRQAKNHLWIRMKDGTIITREITSSVETTSAIETLTLDQTWGADFLAADIDRISYLEEVRFNTDSIRIDYSRGGRQVYFSGPVISIFD